MRYQCQWQQDDHVFLSPLISIYCSRLYFVTYDWDSPFLPLARAPSDPGVPGDPDGPGGGGRGGGRYGGAVPGGGAGRAVHAARYGWVCRTVTHHRAAGNAVTLWASALLTRCPGMGCRLCGCCAECTICPPVHLAAADTPAHRLPSRPARTRGAHSMDPPPWPPPYGSCHLSPSGVFHLQ